mmetsp:Transcript_14821/g.19157  ORF Transcript_14821/g.19157 Transcript_14821/m.19157 type:complete len:157 (+) Transcript_14821:366-836(+)
MASKAFGAGKRNLLMHTHSLLRNGAIPKPLWYDAVVRNPPFAPPPVGPLKEITFPEDKLLRRYYEKNPSSKDEVIDVFDDASKVPAAVFVSKQLKLINTGIPEEEAYDIVEKETLQAALPETSVYTPDKDIDSMKEAFDNWVDAEVEFWHRQTKKS